MAFEAKRIQTEEPESLPFFEQLKIVFSNRPFLFVIGIYLFSWLGVQVTASIIPYFVVNCMGLKESDVPTVMIAVQGTALLMLFVWGALSKKIGKKIVYFLGMSLWIIAAAGLFFLQPGQIVLMYVMAVMAGIGVSTAYLIPWSMIPDVIELDELQTGQRREGIFYGFMVLLQKFGLAFGLFLVGNALQVSGFKESVAGSPLPIQPESALFAIRIAVGHTYSLFDLWFSFNVFLPNYPRDARRNHAETQRTAREEGEGKYFNSLLRFVREILIRHQNVLSVKVGELNPQTWLMLFGKTKNLSIFRPESVKVSNP